MNQVVIPLDSKPSVSGTIDMPQQLVEHLALFGTEGHFREVLEALPAAIYTTDAQGRITFYNKAATELAGREPLLGSDEWCVTWRLFLPDGTPLPHDQCPMAIALRENRQSVVSRLSLSGPTVRVCRFFRFPRRLMINRGNSSER